MTDLMIERYTTPKMKAVWSAQNRFQKWLDVELAACWAHVKMGRIAESDFKIIEEKAAFDVNRIGEIEAEIHHDVIAFLTNLAENIGPESRFVHLGLTSSDVVDTAFSMLIQDATDVLEKSLASFMDALKKQAYAHQETLMMGRTHGVHAEPTTLGLKLTVWYAEMKRHIDRLTRVKQGCCVGKISGAVGNYAHIDPELETLICTRLGLEASPASTQTLQRDRHADYISTIALIGGSLEKFATEIRGLQKTEFNEIIEPFGSKQKGSSAMPHKRNPILCERVTGLSRLLRGYAVAAFENQSLWHERDISHSSAERVLFPDATIALDYMLGLMTRVISGMTVNKQQMLDNIGRSYGVFFSQQLLLKMVEAGMLREEAYRIVQSAAHTAFDTQTSFEKQVRANSAVTDLVASDELDAIFSLDKYQAHTALIFGRVYDTMKSPQK